MAYYVPLIPRLKKHLSPASHLLPMLILEVDNEGAVDLAYNWRVQPEEQDKSLQEYTIYKT